VQHTLLPWLRRFESAFARDLVGNDDEYFVEFDTRGLLRGDAAGRASYYQTLWNLGVASINEIRGWENLNPVEGGDTRFVQLNMQTLASATKEPEKPAEPESPAASVNELVTVLQQVAAGTVAPDAAKAIMAAVFPALEGKSADAIIGGVAPPKSEPQPEPQPDRPAADVGGLAAVIGQVREGVIGADAAVATLGSVYPSLPQETARLIVSGVNAPPAPPAPPPSPAADVSGLLAVLGQVSQGAVTPDAALAIIDAVYPGMAGRLAEDIVGGAKKPPPAAPEAAPPPDQPAESPAGESPRESRSVISIDFDRTFAANPGLWGAFARQSVAAGNTVVMVSRRPDTPENQDHVGSTLGEYRESFSHVLLVGDRLKDEAAREAGVEVDIWIDDSPQFVRAAESRAAADAVAEGDFVSWGSSGGRARGRVEHVMDYGTLDVPGTDFKIDASENDPAALITVYEKVTGGWLPTSTKVGHKVATLTKIGPLEEPKEERAFCATGPGGGVDNSCSAADKGSGPGRVPSSDYGMDYSPANARVVAKARTVPDEKWNQLPVTTIPSGTTLKANEETLKIAPIEKVVSGKEPFREGYVAKLWQDKNGDLHIADGHHRVAMYHALGKDMPARVMTDADYKRLMKGRRAWCPGASPPDNSCSPANKGGGKSRSANVSVPALQRHADKVAGGSYVDGALVTKEFPDGAVVPRDFDKLKSYHAKVKSDLAERIGVPSDKSEKVSNGASTVAELLEDSRQAAPAFKELAEQAAKDSGAEVSFGKADPKNDYLREHAFGTYLLKMPDSLEGKVDRIREERGWTKESHPDSYIVANELKDSVRGTLIADTPESLGDAVRSVRRQAKDQGLAVTIKNRFEDADKTGYAAVHMTLQAQTPAGRPIMTELQFHLRQAYDGNAGSPKDNSHGLYKPDPKTKQISDGSAAAQMLIWSTAFDAVPPPPGGRKPKRRSVRAFCPGVSPPDNSCPPANTGKGKGSGGSNKKGGTGVQKPGRKVAFGTAANAALDNMRKTGGFSVHPITGKSPTTGYMVSVKPESEVIYDSYEQVNESAFRSFYESNQKTFEDNPNLHFGGWVDTSTGKVYFDLSARFDNIDEAIDAAQKTNQLAIWHLDAGQEIRREDYDARRRRPGRAVRSVRLSAGSGRRHGLQGDGGGVSRVCQEGDGRQVTPAVAEGRRVVRLSGSRRAFCPGASPPDNSCSPSNKGTGRPPPSPPVADGKATAGDTRGSSGHSEEQRKAYGVQLENWMLFTHDVTMRIETKGTYPNMDSMQSVAAGIEELARRGEPMPRQVAFVDMPDAAFAGYDFRRDEVHVNPDFRLSRISELSESGWMVSDSKSSPLAAQAMIHEIGHQEHFAALRDILPEKGATDRIRAMLGRPDFLGPTDEPWAPDARLFRNTTKGGVPVDYAAAREIAGSVSKYAQANPIEFVAETRTGLLLGKKYPESVMQLYEDYGGPPLDRRSSRKPVKKAG
jgi:hypothetical protein